MFVNCVFVEVKELLGGEGSAEALLSNSRGESSHFGFAFVSFRVSEADVDFASGRGIDFKAAVGTVGFIESVGRESDSVHDNGALFAGHGSNVLVLEFKGRSGSFEVEFV